MFFTKPELASNPSLPTSFGAREEKVKEEIAPLIYKDEVSGYKRRIKCRVVGLWGLAGGAWFHEK